MTVDRIPDGYSACAGRTKDSWYIGVLLIENRDAPFYDLPGDVSFEQRAAFGRKWWTECHGVPLQIVLFTRSGDGMKREVLSEAALADTPACPREEARSPQLAWVESDREKWHLKLHRDGETQIVRSSDKTIRCATVAVTDARTVLGFESDTGPFETKVTVVDPSGNEIYSTPGRKPVLCGVPGGCVLAVEKSSNDSVHIELVHINGNSVASSTALREGDLLINGDVAWSPDDQCIIAAAESSPRFGFSNQIGSHRTIHTWKWDLKSDSEVLGTLPVEQRAFKSIGPENIAPVKPRVVIDGDRTAVAFKQHRFFTHKTFGWDVFICRLSDAKWSEPARVSPNLTTSDSTLGLVPVDGELIGVFPAHDNEGGPGRSTGHRIEIVRIGPDHKLDRFEIPDEKKADYTIPASYKSISPTPPRFDSPYPGRQLVWGDLHIHTIYSQCVAAVDGDVEENIRYVREVLGCRVFAVAEHTPWILGPQETWRLDRIEQMVGDDNVLLYASEPGLKAMRHTNWYTRDRETFEKLERIFMAQGRNYHDIIRQVRDDLPHDSVFMLRHFHGRAVPEDSILQHFDPHFEVAMESMQGRCNAMLDPREGAVKFPNQFLDAGCKIGLVGGTDHFRTCPNHFCLTGFWVREISAEGVWEAIRNRYTIAMSDSRVAMSTLCKGAPMGSAVTLEEDEDFTVTIQASCERPIIRAGLLRDGEMMWTKDVDAREATFDLTDTTVEHGRHWYVPTLEVETAYEEGHTGICHASPYFLYRK